MIKRGPTDFQTNFNILLTLFLKVLLFFFLLCNFWFTPVLQTLCNSLFLSLAQSLHEKKNIPPKIEVVFVCLFLTVSGHIDFFFKKQTLKFMANTFVGLLVLFKNKLPFSISLC